MIDVGILWDLGIPTANKLLVHFLYTGKWSITVLDDVLVLPMRIGSEK